MEILPSHCDQESQTSPRPHLILAAAEFPLPMLWPGISLWVLPILSARPTSGWSRLPTQGP